MGVLRTIPLGMNDPRAGLTAQQTAIPFPKPAGLPPGFKPPISEPARGALGQLQGQPFTQPAVQAQAQPQFGLAGAEQAFRGGALGGAGALQVGQQNALQTLLGGFQQGQQQLGQGIQALGGNFGAQAQQVDPLTGQPLFREAAAGVQQFAPLGAQAQQRQAALSGVLGQEAFNQALISDPGQQFIRQQGLEGVTNQAAATGGVGGGQVLRDLLQFGQGNAATNIQQQIQNLGALSGQGLQAAGQAGQFLGQAGAQQGQLAGLGAQLGTQANIASAANRLGAARGQADLFGRGAGLAGQLAGQGAGIQFGAGQGIAQLLAGAGQQIGGARTQAGRDIAGQIGGTTSDLSQLIAAQGGGISDIVGAGGVNIANLLSGAGQLTAQQQTQLATLLSNLATGQGTQLANLQGQIGRAQATGTTGQAAGARAGIERLGQLVSGIPTGGAPTSGVSNSAFASQNLGNVAPFTFGGP